MTNTNETAALAYAPLSMKAACIGFLASTTLMILVMTLIGNLR